MPSYLQKFKEQNPRVGEYYSDDEIIDFLPKYDPQTFSNLAPEQVRFKALDDRSAIRRGFSAGVDQLQAMGGGVIGIAGDAVGSDTVRDFGLDIYRRNMEEAALSAPETNFLDIDGVGDAMNWAGYTLGNLAPMMATSVAGGGIGGLLAKRGVQQTAAAMTSRLVAQGMTKEAAAKEAGAFVAKRVALGQALGAGSASVGMSTGNIYGETEDAAVSAVHGLIAGSIDALPIMRIFDRFGMSKPAKEALESSVIREIGKQGVLESGTEAVQTFIEQHANYWVENEGRSLLSNLEDADWREIIEASAAGALGGAAMGGGASAIQRDPLFLRGPSKPEDPLDRAIQGANQAAEQVKANGGDNLDAEIARASTEATTLPPAIRAAQETARQLFSPPVVAPRRPQTIPGEWQGASMNEPSTAPRRPETIPGQWSQPSGAQTSQPVNRNPLIAPLIAQAESLGMTNEVARLEAANRMLATAQRFRDDGQQERAKVMIDRAAAIADDIQAKLPQRSTPATAAAPSGEPAAVWTGRRQGNRDGFPSRQAAEQSLGSRQRTQPELDWRIEEMPTGKFRLAGYAEQITPAEFSPQDIVQPAEFKPLRQSMNPQEIAAFDALDAGRQSQMESDYAAALAQRSDQMTSQAAAETAKQEVMARYSSDAAPANPAMGNALLGAFVRNAPEPQTDARVNTQAEAQADIQLKTDGQPFPNEMQARNSGPFRKTPGATVVPVDGGFGIRMPAAAAQIEQAAQEAATSPENDLPAPTPAQIEAGNYKKGHLRVLDLDISIENPRGSERSGTDPDGKKWSVTMNNHYGYIRKTEGADGDHVDVFVGPNPDSRQVFIVDQVNKDGSFDEHKALIGFNTQQEAIDGYLSNYSKGWKVGPVTAMSADQFKQWVNSDDTKKPLAKSERGAIATEKDLAEIERIKVQAQKDKALQARRRINSDKDTLVQAAIKLGGLTPDNRGDIIGESKGNKVLPGIGFMFSPNGTSIDELAARLADAGYVPPEAMENLGGVPWLQERLADELAGRRTTYAMDSDRAEQDLMRERDRIYEGQAAQMEAQREAEYAAIREEYGEEAEALARNYDEVAGTYDEALSIEAEFYEEQISKQQQFIESGFADATTETGAAVNYDQLRGDNAQEGRQSGIAYREPAADTEPAEGASPEQTIKVAADSLEKLRKQDVYRVLDTAEQISHKHLLDVMLYIRSGRNDLADEVDTSFAEMAEFLKDSKDRMIATMAKNAIARADRAEFKAGLMMRNDGDLAGVQLSNSGETLFVVFSPESGEPGKFRSTYFDARGFSGHSTRDSYERLIDEAIQDGFRQESPGSLERLSQTDAFNDGNAALDALHKSMRKPGGDLELVAQTEAERAALEAEIERKKKAEEQAKALLRNKAQADADRDDFRLSGSSAPADVATSYGQGDMLVATRGPSKPTETRQSGYRIYKTSIRRDGVSTEQWAVQSNDNLLKEQKGERQIGGDALFNTKAEAIAEADAQAKVAERDKANQEAADQRQRDESDQEAQRKADDVNGFTSGMTALAAGRAKKALEKQFRFDGVIQSIRQRVEALASKGELELSTYQESKIKPMTRAQFNRATQREQDAHERKMKEAGKVTVYQVNGSDLGKIGYDYAQHMQDKPAASQEAVSVSGVPESIKKKFPRTAGFVEWALERAEETRSEMEFDGKPYQRVHRIFRGNIGNKGVSIREEIKAQERLLVNEETRIMEIRLDGNYTSDRGKVVVIDTQYLPVNETIASARKSPEQEAVSTSEQEKIGDKVWFMGDEVEVISEPYMLSGGEFVDVRMEDGAVKAMATKAQRDKSAETSRREWEDQQEQFSRLKDKPAFSRSQAEKGNLKIGEFETGKPVTFSYAHNTNSATSIFGLPKKDSPYGRYYEPSGKYMVETTYRNDAPGMEYGEITFQNPLVIANNSLEWKKELSDRYNGKRGKALSKAIIADGYDGVVTVEVDENGSPKYTSEILDLTSFDESKALFSRSKNTKQPDRLSALHNLSAENLIFADEMGGIAVPSIAVVRDDMGMDGFGEITLIGTKALADPKTNEVYDADAYTARFPKPEYPKAKMAAAQELVNEVAGWSQKYHGKREYIVDATWDYAINTPNPDKIANEWIRNTAAKAAFLKEITGSDTRVTMMPKPLRDPVTDHPLIVEFFKKLGPSNDLSQEAGQKAMMDIVLVYRKALEDKFASKYPDSPENIAHLVDAHIAQKISEKGNMFFNHFDAMQREQQDVGKEVVDYSDVRERVDAKLKGKEAKFHAWVTRKVNSIFGEPFIRVGREKRPYTLSNIVEQMTDKTLRGAESSITFGPGKARAMASTRFDSLEWMRNAARDSIASKQDITAARAEAEKVMESYRDKAIKFYKYSSTWEALDNSMKVLADWAATRLKKGSRAAMRQAFTKNDFAKVPDYMIDEAIEAGEALIGSPVPYFEAKPARAVSLNEFRGAVIPKNAGPEVIATLNKHGIRYLKYDPNNEADRELKTVRLRSMLAKKDQDVLFSREGQAQPATIPLNRAQALVSAIAGRFNNAPDVVVVQSMQDTQVPEAVRKEDAKQRSQGAEGEPEGFYYNGKAYVVLDGLTKRAGESDAQAIVRVFAHEVLGHAGLRGLFRGDLDKVLSEVALKRRADINRKAAEYGLDLTNKEDRLAAAEEVLAELAQAEPSNSMVTKAIEAIRKTLRALLMKLPPDVRRMLGGSKFLEWVNSMTDAEIIDRFIVPAREFIRGGDGGSADAVPAFSRAGRAGSDRSAWPANFPEAVFAADIGKSKQHPDYEAAKAGDVDAALTVVESLVDNGAIQRLRDAIGDKTPIVVPVIAEEATGSNMIPLAYAKVVADRLGLESNTDIIQTIRANHTGARAFHRIGVQPVFDGDVQLGADYLIVDDAMAMGGTLANLRGHIEANGGNVILASALTGHPRGTTMAVSDQQKQALISKHGRELDEYLNSEFGFGINALTHGEAAQILSAPSLDEIRSRIAAAQSEAGISPDRPDAESSPVRFSRSDSTNFALPDETLTSTVIRKMQDKFKFLKDLQSSIIKSGGKITEENNAYLAEELFHGKAENDIREMQEQYIEPLADKMAKFDINRDKLDQYLYARHARERNARIAEINPDMPDGGSGMTNAQARAILSEVKDSGKQDQYDQLAGIVYDMLKLQRDMVREGGLENDATIDAWEDSYQYYVPLKGWAEDTKQEGMPRTGKGFAISGRESKRAMGRGSQAASPTSFAIIDLTEKLIRRRKNEVGNAFLKLVRDNPNKDYWQVFTDERPETQRTIKKVKDPETGEMVEQVTETAIPMAMLTDRYFTTKKNGKTFYIKLEDPRLMKAMKNIGPESNNGLIRTMAGITRVMSALNTSYSPEFMVSNFARDVQTAILNLQAEQSLPEGVGKAAGTKIAAKTAKDVPAAMKAIYASLRKKELNTPEGKRWQELFDQFRQDGAKTGWFDMKDLDGQSKSLDNLVAMAQGGFKGKAMMFAQGSARLVENLNQAVENAVRLSAYANAIEAGISRKQAASLAKNMTVNFNRRGEVGTTMNALYMFANASVQGTANLLRTMATFKGDGSPRWKNMNNAQKIAAGIVAGAYFIGMANRMAAGEDEDDENWYDKVPDYVKERNLVLMKSLFGGPQDGSYWKIPLPYGYNVFSVLGTSMESVLGGGKPLSGAAADIALATMGSFSPIGFQESDSFANMFLKNAAPSIIKPIVEIGLNENFMGTSIYTENMPFGTPKPDSSLGRQSTPEAYRKLSAWLNEVTGGSEYRPGAVDINPDVMQHFLDYFGGSAYAFFGSKVPDYIHRSASGVAAEENRIPFISRISGRVLPYADTEKFYRRRDQINQVYDEFRAMPADERDNFDGRAMLRLRPLLRGTEKQLTALRQQRNAIYSADMSLRERDPQLKEIEQKMKTVVARFNKAFNEADQ